MKNKWIIASVLIVVLLGICAASIFAVWQGVRMAQDSGVQFRLGAQNVSAKATEEKSLKVSGPASLTIINDFGDINVEAGADGQISVKAEKTAWGSSEPEAQAALQQDLKVVYEQDGNNLKVSIQRPVEVDALWTNKRASMVNFTVVVPKDSNLTAETNNGDLAVNNLAAEGEVKLSSEFGEITVDTLQGSDVILSSANGAIDVSGVKASGLLRANSDFGVIHIFDSSAAAADIHSNNGSVRLQNLTLDGKVTVKSDFGDLILFKVVAAAYDLRSNNGKVDVDGARGPIAAHSEFGEVSVTNAENATLDLSSNNGGVTFAGSLGAGPHTIKSEFGNVKLTLPAEQALNLDLQTEFGKITSDFDLTVSGKLNEKHWTGKINGGGDTLTIKDSNGNITLQIAK